MFFVFLLTHNPTAALELKIREYLSKNNISKTSDIAEYIGLSLPRTRAILKEIPDVSPIGNNSNRKWTLQK